MHVLFYKEDKKLVCQIYEAFPREGFFIFRNFVHRPGWQGRKTRARGTLKPKKSINKPKLMNIAVTT